MTTIWKKKLCLLFPVNGIIHFPNKEILLKLVREFNKVARFKINPTKEAILSLFSNSQWETEMRKSHSHRQKLERPKNKCNKKGTRPH